MYVPDVLLAVEEQTNSDVASDVNSSGNWGCAIHMCTTSLGYYIIVRINGSALLYRYMFSTDVCAICWCCCEYELVQHQYVFALSYRGAFCLLK